MTVHEQSPDFYAFDLAPNSALQIEALFIDATADIDLFLYDENGVQLDSSTSGSDTLSRTLSQLTRAAVWNR